MAEKEYTVVAPDGKEITLIGPVGASQDEIIAQAQKLYKPQATGPYLGGDRPAPIPEQPKVSAIDRLKALYEVPATVATSAVAPFLGVGKGIVENIQKGTNERVDRPELAQQFVYEPTSPVSQDILESMGKTFEAAKIPAYVPGAGQLGRAATATKGTLPTNIPNLPSYNQFKQTVQPSIANLLRQKETSALSGVGSAEVPEVAQRVQLAQNLRVPIKLSKGQATRELGQQAFEAETPKNYPDVGKPLVQAQAARNEGILQNFDAFVDATGKESYGLRATGKIVDEALVNASNKAKKEINDAYKLARDAGETAELVDVTPVQKFLSGLEAESINAPIIKSAEVKLNSLAKNGKVSINDLEEIRKMVNRLSGDTKSNMEYGRQINQLIDSTTEQVGGQLYKDARALRAKYAKEFENIGVVDKLLSKKPGTSDRSVALEDVFSHSILNGSLDDVRNIGKTLKKAGPEGEQAWKELQGQTIEHIKDQVTRSIDTDSFGNPVVSPAKFKAVVRELDQDGKLDYVFGKKGAQEVRDLLETAIAVNAPLKGAANYSNTASALIRALDRIGGTPLGKIPGFGAVSEYATKQAVKKQVKEALEFNPADVAKELRKGQ